MCTVLVATFILGFAVLMFSLPWLAAMGPRPSTSVAMPALARPSGQAIATTCARMANVDMSGLITRAQAEEMEHCAERMMALLR